MRRLKRVTALPPVTAYTVTGRKVELPQRRLNFSGAVDKGQGSYMPDFRSLRRNGSQLVFELLLGETTPEDAVRRQKIKATTAGPPRDLSHIMMEAFIKSELDGVKPIAV
jgi:hypothetical protein